MFDQLSYHFGNKFNKELAAFRKGFGSQTTLLRLLEDWERELDNHRYVGAILMVLSKARNANSSFIFLTENVYIWHNDCLWDVDNNKISNLGRSYLAK